MVELDQTTLLIVMTLTAVLSSVFTLVMLLLAYKYKIGPEIEKKVEGQLKKSVNIMEERIRKRMIEVLSGKSEVLVDRARGLAKTGISLFASGPTQRGEGKYKEDD